MFGSGKNKNAAKKAYEIAYALFRVSAKISESVIKERLESRAMDLLTSVNAEEYGNAAKTAAAIDALVKFATDLNIISIQNSDVLLREIGIMSEEVAECLDKSDDVDVSKFFSAAPQEKQENVTLDSFIDSVEPAETALSHAYSFVPEGAPDAMPPRAVQFSARSVTPAETMSSRAPSVIPAKAMSSRNPSVIPAEAGIQAFSGSVNLDPVFQRDDKEVGKWDANAQSGNPANILKSGNRQIAILDRIRQSGNCKLKEIQDVLPNCSERTIRYDLEDLIERNLVERIGSGGPAVSYRIRQIS